MHAGGTNIPVYQKKERKCTAARRISKDYGRQIRSDGLGPEQAVQSTVYFSTAPAAGRRSPIPWAGGARRQDWLALAESWVVLSLVIGVRELRKFLVLGGVTYLGGEGERGEKVYCTYIRSRSFTRLPHHVTLFSVSQLPDHNTYVHLAPCSARVPQPLFFHHNRKSPLCRDFYWSTVPYYYY